MVPSGHSRRWQFGLSLIFAGSLLLVGCATPPGGSESSNSSSSSNQAGDSAGSGDGAATASASDVMAGNVVNSDGTMTCVYEAAAAPVKPVDPPPGTSVEATGTVEFTFSMTEGNVVISADRAQAPCTVNSFASLIQQGFYDGTSCHRLVDEGIHVLQCGDPSGTGRGGPGYTFGDELTGGEIYPPGVVAMANAGPNTNGSQFFFVWDDSPLPPSYTVFGTIDEESLAVVKAIADAGISTTEPPKPNSPAAIEQVSVG